MYTSINIDFNLKTPKYKQIVNSIISDIEKGVLQRGQRIASINETSEEYYLSRDTVEKAYQELRERGIITSVRGKGYYISHTGITAPIRVLLLFNKISAYKKLIYNAFIKSLGTQAVVDLHIHHSNVKLFENLILNNLGNYHYYAVMPHFYDDFPEAMQVIKKIPRDKLILMDRDVKGLDGEYASIYQDFELDIHQTLYSGLNLLRKYRKLNLVFPKSSVPFPMEITKGFKDFCEQACFDYSILNEVDEYTVVRPREAYIVIEETDLANLIKKTRTEGLELGKDIGVISYNDTPLKEILSNGITVISTDHEKMGEAAAEMILSKKRAKVKNPFRLIVRNSL